MARLINRWFSALPNKTYDKLVEIILQIVSVTNDTHVKYECCMCIKNMMKSNIMLNYSVLFEKISPTIFQLFNKLSSAHIIWELIQLFILLIQNIQNNQTSFIENIIKNANIDKLLNTDQEFLVEPIYDMLTHLLVAFPIYTPIPYIYSICLKFIAIQL